MGLVKVNYLLKSDKEEGMVKEKVGHSILDGGPFSKGTATENSRISVGQNFLITENLEERF